MIRMTGSLTSTFLVTSGSLVNPSICKIPAKIVNAGRWRDFIENGFTFENFDAMKFTTRML